MNDKTILVTGGTGSFGKRFIRTVLDRFDPRKVIIYSRDELKQFEMQQSGEYEKDGVKINYFIGDVRDLPRLKLAMEDVDIVVHTAALKQVPAAEYNPFEAVKTNIIGGQNVIEASMGSSVQKVIALSTDKAAAPVNLYGATKLTSDKLFIAANNYRGTRGIKLSVVRYGNVMGSRGSVIPFFVSKRKDGVLPVTDGTMTRFNITLQRGVDFVLECLDVMWGGELFVPKIPSYRILDLAEAIAPECEVKIVGVRPGEKIHEDMITESDAMNTIEFEDYFVILPSTPLWDTEKFRLESSRDPGEACALGFKYNSLNNGDFLSSEDLRRMVEGEM